MVRPRRSCSAVSHNTWCIPAISQRTNSSVLRQVDLDSAVSYCTSWIDSSISHLTLRNSGWDIHDQTYSRELLISNRGNGYRDVIAKIDLSTYRRIPWEGNVPFFLVSFLDPETKEPICACPRGTLLRAMKRAELRNWECVAGVEYEVSICSCLTVKILTHLLLYLCSTSNSMV